MFDAANPYSAFATPVEEPAITVKTSKTKKIFTPKAWTYTGTKLITETAAN